MGIKIVAIEKHLPCKRFHSSKMDELANVPMGKIEKHTGVQYRYHISGSESVCTLAAEALKKALISAGSSVNSIDLLIFAGASFDYPIPHNAAIIKSMIADDTVGFHCLDINSTCLSFLNALDIANMYLETNRYKRIALVCSEVASAALTPKDELVYGLFGDGAVALILEKHPTSGYKQLYVNFINYTSGALYAQLPIGGAVNRGIHATSNDSGYYFRMDGKALFRLTTRYIDNFVNQIELQTNIQIGEFDKIIPHQTSKMGNNFLLNHFNLNADKVVETLSIYGNCIAASIPLGLEMYYNQLKKEGKQKILLFGSGAGLSLGAIVLEFD